MKHLDHQLRCPCGRVLMTFHVGDAPKVRAAGERVRRAKFTRELARFGKKPPKGKDLGRVRAMAEPAQSDLGPELAEFWARHDLRERLDPTVHYCACGAVVRHESDAPGAPARGLAVGRHDPEGSPGPDARGGRGSSDPAATPHASASPHPHPEVHAP